jgi:fluoride exporter
MAGSRPRSAKDPARLPDVAIGGALGTGVRLLIGGPVVLLAAPPGPVRLLAINVGGAFLLGVLLGVRERRSTVTRWWPLLVTGLLGGLTTFSTMIVQAGSLGHAAGLVVSGSGRMTPTGLGLVSAYLAVSVTLGLAALIAGRKVGQRTSASARVTDRTAGTDGGAA